MRCMSHYYDVSSYIGICATCLRQRLSALTESEEQQNSENLQDNYNQHSNSPPPLLLPHSASKYTIKHHLNDASNKHPWILPDQKFFSTPLSQITTKNTNKKHTAANKFSIITKLFKSKSERFTTETNEQQNHLAVPPSPGWFSSFRKKAKINESDHTPNANRASCNVPSGDTAKKKSRRSKSSTNFTGLIFGMSPLVQPSPIRLRSHNSYSSESFEIRAPAKAMMSTSSSLRGSRSRKIVESQPLVYPL